MNIQTYKRFVGLSEYCSSDYRRGYRRAILRKLNGDQENPVFAHKDWLMKGRNTLDVKENREGEGYRDGWASLPPQMNK